MAVFTPEQEDTIREIIEEKVEDKDLSLVTWLVDSHLESRGGAITALQQEMLQKTREIANEEINKHVRLIGRSAMDESAAATFDKNFHDAIVTVLEQAVGIQLWQGSAGAQERMNRILVVLRG